jgi:hypothetical protein
LLRYEVHQIHLEGLGRYYLPLPKLNASQAQFLLRHFQDRGFSVRTGNHLMNATAGKTRLTVDPAGLSWSSGELLDPIAPAIPTLLAFSKERAVSNDLDQRYLYFSAKKIKERRLEIQLFTRMESLRTWTALRNVGLCGLTPDEKAVIASLLGGAEGNVECVTDYFSEMSSSMPLGRKQYYRSTISIDEFVSTLRTLSHSSQKNSYLPRESILRVRVNERFDSHSALDALGEWCYLQYSSKNL